MFGGFSFIQSVRGMGRCRRGGVLDFRFFVGVGAGDRIQFGFDDVLFRRDGSGRRGFRRGDGVKSRHGDWLWTKLRTDKSAVLNLTAMSPCGVVWTFGESPIGMPGKLSGACGRLGRADNGTELPMDARKAPATSAAGTLDHRQNDGGTSTSSVVLFNTPKAFWLKQAWLPHQPRPARCWFLCALEIKSKAYWKTRVSKSAKICSNQNLRNAQLGF